MNRSLGPNVYQDIMTRSNKDRYQVLVNNEPVRNFSTKREANAYVRECKARGVKPSLWDTRNNPISKLTRLKRATMKHTVYQWYLVVEGAGSFPFDMLRYDSCFPFGQVDSAKLDGRVMLNKRRVVLVRRGVNDSKCSGDRWKSFGWTVLLATVESYEARALALTVACKDCGGGGRKSDGEIEYTCRTCLGHGMVSP